jgi:hypothetical protein
MYNYCSDLRWLVFNAQDDPKYPFWIFIEYQPKKFVFLKTKEKWPGPSQKLFCKYEGEASEDALPPFPVADSCKIFSIRRNESRLSLVLNRSQRKRCWFVFVKKEYKKKPGQFYHQVFWITQSASIGERRGIYIPRKAKGEYLILIDINERYPYKFGEVKTKRDRLPIGDYALYADGKIIAVVERKTKDNFLHELSFFDVWRIRLQEMEQYPYKAVIFEDEYLKLITHPLKKRNTSKIADALADLMAEFPSIQFLFFKGKKSANKWLFHYFQRVYQRYMISRGEK